MNKRLKTYWLMKIMQAGDPIFFIRQTLNDLNIDPDTAYCLITLILRLHKKRYIKCSMRDFRAFENRVLDAEGILGRTEKSAIMYYNKNLFNWERDIGRVFPKRHY